MGHCVEHELAPALEWLSAAQIMHKGAELAVDWYQPAMQFMH
jgi:hypothetical protein